MEKPLTIGIDPDIDKNGVAIYNKVEKIVTTKTLSFFELFEFLKIRKDEIDMIKIECGFLIKKSNWHYAKSATAKEKIAKDVGRNHQVATLLIQMCEYLGLHFVPRKPLKLIWRGDRGKITQPELENLLSQLKVTLNAERKNQDARDSVLICLY